MAYQYARAKICGYTREAEQIAETVWAYRAKTIGAPLKETKKWLNCRVRVMTELIRNKFQNNENCKQWLLCSDGKKLYEGTTDKLWATGIVLARATEIKSGKFPGQNKLGEILEKVREELKKG